MGVRTPIDGVLACATHAADGYRRVCLAVCLARAASAAPINKHVFEMHILPTLLRRRVACYLLPPDDLPLPRIY